MHASVAVGGVIIMGFLEEKGQKGVTWGDVGSVSELWTTLGKDTERYEL